MGESQLKGVVAAGHAATVEAAAQTLRKGGNAVDAAIAGVFASLIAEPVLTGLFGGGILNMTSPSGECSVLDFFARVPGLSRAASGDLDFRAVEIDFGPTRQEFHIGTGSAAVPGTMTGLWEAHRLWGTLPMQELVRPACTLARQGVPLTPQMAFIVELLRPILVFTREARELFTRDGELLSTGDPFLNPTLADVLESLAAEGLGGPTHREINAAVIGTFGGDAGLITEEDLRTATPIRRDPLSVNFFGASVMLPPPPLLGGSLVALGLELLSEMDLGGPHSAAGATAIAAVQAAMSNSRRDLPEVFLARDRVRALLAAAQAVQNGATPTGSTTHISVVDSAGMAVSITHSNGEGCGYVVPGTGIFMNNFLGEEDINPNGFHQQAPGEAMLTMMCPTIVRAPSDKGDALWVLGTGGSNRIRSSVLQVLTNLLAWHMGPEAAVVSPRTHVESGVLNVELSGRTPQEREALHARYDEVVHFQEPNMFFGGVHLAGRRLGGYTGAGDRRRGGDCHVVSV